MLVSRVSPGLESNVTDGHGHDTLEAPWEHRVPCACSSPQLAVGRPAHLLQKVTSFLAIHGIAGAAALSIFFFAFRTMS